MIVSMAVIKDNVQIIVNSKTTIALSAMQCGKCASIGRSRSEAFGGRSTNSE
jgi:hypothetical protein